MIFQQRLMNSYLKFILVLFLNYIEKFIIAHISILEYECVKWKNKCRSLKTRFSFIRFLFSNGLIKENHELPYSAGQPVICKFCEKSFQTVVALKRHLKTHIMRYACQFCPLTFSTKALRQRHEKIHEGGAVLFFRWDACIYVGIDLIYLIVWSL